MIRGTHKFFCKRYFVFLLIFLLRHKSAIDCILTELNSGLYEFIWYFRDVIKTYYKYTAGYATLSRDLSFRYLFLFRPRTKEAFSRICIIAKNLHNGKECIMRSYTSMCVHWCSYYRCPVGRRTVYDVNETNRRRFCLNYHSRLKRKRLHVRYNYYIATAIDFRILRQFDRVSLQFY